MQKPEQELMGYRVLVVEDEGLIAHDIAKRLEALGHTVVGTASTAEEAIEAAAAAELVLMDIRIDGDRDGIDAAAEIRDRFHIPVIFLTAHADRSTIERAKATIPYGYMVKPLGPATLQASIEIALYKHGIEHQLEEREAWLRTTVASAGEAIVAADKQGNVLLMNQAAETLTGVSAEAALGKPLAQVLCLADSTTGREVRELDALAIVRNSPTPLDHRLEVVTRSGQRRAVEGTIAPVRTSSGTAGVVVSLHDVSAERWQDRRLQQSQRIEAAARLAAGLASDYSNLVDVIRHRVGQLLAQFGEYSPARKALEEIHQAASLADQLTKRLEAFGTRRPLRQELVSLNGILRRLTPLIESLADDRLKVAIHPKPGLGRVLADASQLEQAIMTLTMHACSATADGGVVNIETAVIETGPGEKQLAMTLRYSCVEEDTERLFDPVQQGGEDSLGLAMVQSIVGEQGGLIFAQTYQEGTKIQVLLPLVEEAPVSAGLVNLPTPSVLLVDARERVRAHLHNAAEAAGYDLLEAATWEEAATLCEMHHRPVDVLVAQAQEAEAILLEVNESRHPRQILRVVERAAQTSGEIESPFTEQAFFERIQELAPKGRSATSS